MKDSLLYACQTLSIKTIAGLKALCFLFEVWFFKSKKKLVWCYTGYCFYLLLDALHCLDLFIHPYIEFQFYPSDRALELIFSVLFSLIDPRSRS